MLDKFGVLARDVAVAVVFLLRERILAADAMDQQTCGDLFALGFASMCLNILKGDMWHARQFTGGWLVDAGLMQGFQDFCGRLGGIILCLSGFLLKS